MSPPIDGIARAQRGAQSAARALVGMSVFRRPRRHRDPGRDRGQSACARMGNAGMARTALGAWISIAFLYALGLLNLYSVFAAPADQWSRPPAEKPASGPVRAGQPSGADRRRRRPVCLVLRHGEPGGAVLAHGLEHVGLGFAIVLGAAFMLGMMTTDGVNGLWVAKLLARADRRALVASRAMGLAIAACRCWWAATAWRGCFFPPSPPIQRSANCCSAAPQWQSSA